MNREYNIADHNTVTIWCRKYGKSTDSQAQKKGTVEAKKENEIIRLHIEEPRPEKIGILYVR